MAAAKKTAKKATKKTAKKATAKKAGAKKAAAKKGAAKKGAKKTAAKRASTAASVRVPTSQVKDFARASGLRASGDLADAVSQEVNELLAKAAERAKSNNRGTIRPQDL